ncbi:MAG TPA: fatty acid desaturase [Gemmataceae bacterium]
MSHLFPARRTAAQRRSRGPGIGWLAALGRLPSRLWLTPLVLMHLAALGVFFVPVTATALVLCGVVYYARMVALTAGYHRYFAHRSYRTSRPVQFLLGVLGCTAMQRGPLWWASNHRAHHRHSDTPDDPHSPVANSLWWSHVGWLLSKKYERTDRASVRDLTRYPELRWLERLHWLPGILLGVLCYQIDGLSGLVWGFFVSTVLLYHATFLVNSVCHLFGRRRYATADDSRNNALVAVLTCGEGWHNNHHCYQSSANQGFYWWEIDISYYFIRLLGLLGLVWDIRKPPLEKLRSSELGARNAERKTV